MLDLPEQGHANLFRHAARGDVFGVNQRAEALQAQMVEPVVTTGQCSLRCESLYIDGSLVCYEYSMTIRNTLVHT